MVKVGDRVAVRFPDKPKQKPILLGEGAVKEIGRKTKGKKYDIEVIMDSGRTVYCNAHHLQPITKQTSGIQPLLPGIVAPKTVPKPSTGKTSTQQQIGEESSWNEVFSDEFNKLPACSRCNNGFLYTPDSKSIWKDKIYKFINIKRISGCRHIILVPEKMNLGRRGLSERKKTDVCHRCEGGSVVRLNKEDKADASVNHRALVRRGIVAVIFVR